MSLFASREVQLLVLFVCCAAMIVAGSLTVNLYAKCATFSGTEPVHADTVGWIEAVAFGVVGFLVLIGGSVFMGPRVFAHFVTTFGMLMTCALGMSALVLFVGGAFGVSVYTACSTWTSGDDMTVINTELGFIIAAMLAGLVAILYAVWRVYKSLSSKPLGQQASAARDQVAQYIAAQQAAYQAALATEAPQYYSTDPSS